MEQPASTPLLAELVREPRFFTMNLRLSDDALEVAVFNPDEDNSLIYRKLALTPDEKGSCLKSLEETVYENPLLLSRFGKCGILIETGNYTVIPLGIADDPELVEQIVAESESEAITGKTVVVNRVESLNAAVAMSVPDELVSFLRRAFDNPPIYAHVTPLLQYFADRRRRGNTARFYVNIRRGAFDIFVYAYEQLVVCNTIPFRDVADAAYYIIAYREMLGYNDPTDGVLVSGDAALRRELLLQLRRFVESAMPVIFPSAMFRLGREILDIPFELSILPLCE